MWEEGQEPSPVGPWREEGAEYWLWLRFRARDTKLTALWKAHLKIKQALESPNSRGRWAETLKTIILKQNKLDLSL